MFRLISRDDKCNNPQSHPEQVQQLSITTSPEINDCIPQLVCIQALKIGMVITTIK
jgi:hypothetical protein